MLKKVVAPQFNYISMMLPVGISPQQFKQYERSIKAFLWDIKKTKALLFEMFRLTKHWKETEPELSWIKTERELVSPFKPLNVLLHGSITKSNHVSRLLFKPSIGSF